MAGSAPRAVGYPLLVKPAGAGGGRGLRHVGDEAGLIEAILASRREVGATAAGSARSTSNRNWSIRVMSKFNLPRMANRRWLLATATAPSSAGTRR